MANSSADVVICGAGIAGVAAAYFLSVKAGVRNVVLVDERAPLTLTSDKSTECYRNWWPGPGDAMVRLMDRSIDLMEELARESDNAFDLNRRGYVYVTASPQGKAAMEQTSRQIASLGPGPLRVHEGQSRDPLYSPSAVRGFESQPIGADLLLDKALITRHFPYITPHASAVLHARRCGWLSAQQLGMYLLEQARLCGVRLVRGKVDAVNVGKGQVQAVHLQAGSGASTLATSHFVNAAGPFLKDVGALLGIELPVFSELHLKMAFDDHLSVVPRDVPMLIWNDPVLLPWASDERAYLAESEETRWMLKALPAGAHLRPEGGAHSSSLLMLWPYHLQRAEPTFPFKLDPLFPELVLRALSLMMPGLSAYLEKIPKPQLDGGYYTKTRENRPLIGPLSVRGSYVIGALSGYGVMAACAAGELLAAHIVRGPLPPYAPAFSLERYDDPAYQRLLEHWGDEGQL